MQSQVTFIISGSYDLVKATSHIDKAIKKSGSEQYAIHCLPTGTVEVTVTGGSYRRSQVLSCVDAAIKNAGAEGKAIAD